LFILIFFYALVIKNLSKYKLDKYLKIFLNKRCILLIITAAFISNTYILFLNSKYNNFYEKPPSTIQAEAVIVRRLTGKRIYGYVYSKN